MPFEGRETAESLSQKVNGVVVELAFDAQNEVISARAADHGNLIREIGFYGWAGWMSERGVHQPWEDQSSMGALMDADTAPDVDGFFKAFLGPNGVHGVVATLFQLTGEPHFKDWSTKL